MRKTGTNNPMRVTNVPVGYYSYSSEVCFDFRSLPSNSTIDRIEFQTSQVIGGKGAFNLTHFIVECGNAYAAIPWNGWSQIISVDSDDGISANVNCCLSFYGYCVANTSGSNPGCTYSRSADYMIMDYYY